MKHLGLLIVMILGLLSHQTASAAPLRVYVAEFNATGIQNRDEMKGMLQSMLASRLSSPTITTVEKIADSDLTVSGTYVVIGKIFSIDAVARTSSGQVLTRSFIQGDNQDEMIPALGKLAEKLSSELARIYTATPATSLPTPSAAPNSEIIRPTHAAGTVKQAPQGDIVRPQSFEKSVPAGWLSKRIPGAVNLLALGTRLPDGSREIFLAQDRIVQFYRQGAELKLVTSFELTTSEKIVSLDVADGDANGTPELYVTVIRNGEPASHVYEVRGDKLIRVAASLPYFFRSATIAGGPKKLYAQQLGRDGNFYGDVTEAARTGSSIVLKNTIKMPRFGNIYSFNQFRNADGKLLTVVINPDNYLVVFDSDSKELWRSNDKFGGSELFFQQEDLDNVRVTGDRYRWIFMNQKIHVTARNEIVVGKNDGFWVLGNARSYKKGAVFAFAWDGSSLEERWRTRDTQNYMPDYLYDEEKGELLMLQLTQRAGFGDSAASSLAIRKVE